MEKLKLAVFSVLESLVYMLVALMTAFAADTMWQEISWQMAAAFCILIALLMSYMLYANKTQGYGFIDDEEDDEEEDGEE